MLLGISSLIAGYVVLAVLLLNVNLYSNWPWYVKATTILVTTAFYFISYLSIPPLLGWATTQALPTHFKLLATEVQEPNKLTKEDGVIFLWVQEVHDRTAYNPPRGYKLGYSKVLHNAVIGAQEKIDQGIEQLGEQDNSNPIDMFAPDAKQTGQESVKIRFYDLPDLLLMPNAK